MEPTSGVNRLQSLADNVINHEDFNPADLRGFNAAKELSKLDNFDPELCGLPEPAEWKRTTVDIPLPATRQRSESEDQAFTFTVENVWHRPLLPIIIGAFTEPGSDAFHIFPYHEYWRPKPNEPPQRLLSEIFDSNRFTVVYAQVLQEARALGYTGEIVVAALMLWSDSTQITRFSSMSLWPVYLYFANLSKYDRVRPSAFAAHHLAYIPKLSKRFEEFYHSVFGVKPTDDVLRFARREVVHAIYFLILDDEFLHAYVYGHEMEFWDGVVRHLFPCFFSHSMDYPEKILLACIKYLGACPCPKCLVRKSKIPLIGWDRDMSFREKNPRVMNSTTQEAVEEVRRLIFENGVALSNKNFDEILGHSRVPVRNAFYACLGQYGFDPSTMIVPDPLHEFNLGVWKNVFHHLIRILYAHDAEKVGVMDRR
ncbi:hypothetical protein BKA70DRAFT_1123239 [Coprinopsis sp. MPI-PUGE-AT-0042]|nr:hypothetical protein BKA70DRAFT_1123239 [Coprinopsis sp. MPI-PUGE-AT-0042]